MTTSFKEVTAREPDPRSFLTTFRPKRGPGIGSSPVGPAPHRSEVVVSCHAMSGVGPMRLKAATGLDQSPSEGYLQVTANVDAQRKENDS